ncbi:MAG: VCBS repeat-containing protein [Solirubrobacteraceae bacterium]|nr:VCBS repeat-containing protein [Solirubrobacteraceae bacterium]
MSRLASRLRRPSIPRAVALSVFGLGVTALSLPAGAAAGPLKATSFVRGTAAAENVYRSPQRSFAGDFDGDGKDDVIYADNGNSAWLVYGTSPSSDADLGTDLGTRGWKITPLVSGVYDVDGAGDFDGDGVDDVVINSSGEAFIVYGSRTRRTGTLAIASGQTTQPAGVTRIANVIYSAGKAAGIGDFDGDGYDDIALQRDQVGASIVRGGPRVATLSASAQGTRTSLVNAIRRCGIVWFTYRCVSLGVNFDEVGDFDGDGKDDLIVESSAADGNFMLYGRTGSFTVQAVAQTGVTRLPNGQTGDRSQLVGNYHGVGDVNGDGRGDVVGFGTVLTYGRAGRPGSILRTSPLVTLRHGTSTDFTVERVGDQNADGKDDLAVYAASASGSPVRIVTSLPAAPATVDTSLGTPVAGLPADAWLVLAGGGDLDGDGLGDLLVPTVYPSESTYLVTHGTGSPGSVGRPASVRGNVVLLDANGNTPLSNWTATLTTTCGGRTGPAVESVNSTEVTLANASEGEECTVQPSITLTDPAPFARCIWRDTYTVRYLEPVPAGAPFTLKAGVNQWQLERRCTLPATDFPTSFQAVGWSAAGSALDDFSAQIALTPMEPNKAGAVMWGAPLDYRNRTIEFDMRIAGGSGPGEGATLALVRPDASGQPEGGRVGGTGPLLGFGGLGGVAVAFDTKQDAGDPSGNFIGLTDGAAAGKLRWIASSNLSAALRNPSGQRVKVVFKAGRTIVYINGVMRMNTTTLKVPASAFLAFTASTGTLHQLHNVYNLTVRPS